MSEVEQIINVYLTKHNANVEIFFESTEFWDYNCYYTKIFGFSEIN